MKDINLGQFVSSFFKIDFARKNQSQAAGFNPELYSLESQLQQQDDIQRSFEQSRLNINKDIDQAKTQLAKLDNPSKTVLLKELLNLPKDIKDFVTIMSEEPQLLEAELLPQNTLLLAKSIDMSKLAQFIQENGKEALSKLFQMIANYNQLGTSIKSSQLNELTTVINACVSAAGEKPTQLLKNVMLLYLPWLPLTDGNAFKLEIEERTGAKSSRDDSITILISTINFGNVQVFLSKPDKSSINVEITCSKDFPVEKCKLAINEEAVNYNVQSTISESVIEEAENKTKDPQLQISMKVSPGVNPFLILMANSVIKVIIAIDNLDNVRQARKEML